MIEQRGKRDLLLSLCVTVFISAFICTSAHQDNTTPSKPESATTKPFLYTPYKSIVRCVCINVMNKYHLSAHLYPLAENES